MRHARGTRLLRGNALVGQLLASLARRRVDLVTNVRATGASALDEIVYGVLPQVMPLWISYSLYRFESNVRSASVVGMVGAGGIGVIVHEVIRGFEYAQASAVMLIIIVFVTLIDMASALVRRVFI